MDTSSLPVINPAPRGDSAFVRVTIGEDVFEAGDGRLISTSVVLAEGREASGCEFEVYDPDGYYANKYFSASYANGGVDLPSEFFDEPQPEQNAVAQSPTQGNTGTDFSGGTVSKGGKFTPEIRAFLDLIALKEVPVPLNLQGYYANNGIPGSGGFFNDVDIQIGRGFPATAGSSFNVGRYQFNRGDWSHAKESFPELKSYTPQDQDLLCYFKLQYRGALAPLQQGDIKKAIYEAGKEWASLPGARADSGRQVPSGYTEAQALTYYNQRLAVYKAQTSAPVAQQSQPKATAQNENATGSQIAVKRVLAESAQVSFYGLGDGFQGRKTANGEIFDTNKFTAAHKTLPFGTLVKVTYAGNSVVVKINDRGPYSGNRVLDISYAAMKALGNTAVAAGVITAKLEIVESGAGTVTSNKANAKQGAGQSIQIAKTAPAQESPGEVSAKGTQITVEMSLSSSTICAFSYFHTGTNFDGPVENTLSFDGQSIRWILNRRLKNTRYQDITLKGLATQIARSHNLILSMEDEGPSIKAVSQASQSDLKFLNTVCDRLGYMVQDVGKTLIIKRRALFTNQPPGFVLSVGKNLISFSLSDKAQTDAVGSSEKIKVEQGQQTTVLDTDTGSFRNIAKQNKESIGDKKAVTGLNIPETQLPVEGADVVGDKVYQRPEGKPVKEFTGQASLFTSQAALELLTPDMPFYLEGTIEFGRRAWFIESVRHSWKNGVLTSDVSFYLPVPPKQSKQGNPEASQDKATTTSSSPDTPPSAGVGKIADYLIRTPLGTSVNAFKDLSPHWRGSGNYARYIQRAGQFGGKISHLVGRPEQLVYDFTIFQNGSPYVPVPSPVVGEVVSVGGSNGIVSIRAEGGAAFRLLHMSGIRVKVGDRVNYGTILGTQGSVGPSSTGVHLHYEGSEAVLTRYIKALLAGNFAAGQQ